MAKINPMLECLARYSSTNLALVVFDNQESLPKRIWSVAGRNNYCALIADNTNLDAALEAAKDSRLDGILYRLIENLSYKNQKKLNDVLVKMPAEQKGKFIFTTNDFNLIESHLLKQACRIKFRVNLEDEAAYNEPVYIDVQARQREVGRYF